MEPYLSPVEHALISIQLRAAIGKVKHRYTDEFKTFAVSVYFKSPACYRFLATRFKLPSVSTIQSWLAKFQVSEGFCPNLLKLLALRCRTLEDGDRVCNLIVDEISLRRAVTYDTGPDQLVGVKTDQRGQKYYPTSALVFLISGLKAKWKQSVAYFFVQNSMPTDNVLKLTHECIDHLEAIGFHVAVFSSDQGPNFSAMLNRLGVSKDHPYFMHRGKKVYVVADMPHIIKSVRNCLLKNDIITEKGTAKWCHIEDFYKRDKIQRLRLCPKLTDRHFNMQVFGAKMKVKFATQVLSASVASALATYANLGALENSANETAEFCQQMNDLFDALNSSTKSGKTTFQGALRQDSPLLEFLDMAYTWISSWKVRAHSGTEVTGRFKFIEGLLLNISSVKQLLTHLVQDFDFQYLCTRRLCTDATENYFCIIRSKGGFNSNPSCLSFAQAFRQSVAN